MANDFVRNVKGVRNINKLSRNITTENDLISTNDNDVYVVTNAGYKKITGGETEQDIQVLETDVKNLKTSTDNNTSDIDTLKTSTGNNTSEIETLKTLTDNNTSTDTGWVTFQTINDTVANEAFTAEGDNGFNCAYRVIDYGDRKEKYVRINVINVSHLTIVAELPKDFAKNVQFHYVRVPINKGYGLVGLYPSGSLYVYIESDKRKIWNETDYYYGEFRWVE